MRTILTNCKIYDGTNSANTANTIVIENDKIVKVATDYTEKDTKTIDLGGQSVAPGFIDAHSHNDWFAIKNETSKYFECFAKQGITSFVAGNCGLSSSGYNPNSPHKDKIGAGLFFNTDTSGEYGSYKEFFDAIDNNVPLNIASLAGHCTARTSVSGYENRDLTPEEDAEMMGLMEQAMEDGACGLSLGLMYEPGIYAKTEELRKIVKLCEKYNKPLTVHPRACSSVSMSYPIPFGRSHLLKAADELVEITRGTKVKLQYSHAIFVGKNSFSAQPELIKLIEGMRADGVDAMFDIYSELCGVSIITVIMPGWFQVLSIEDKKKFGNVMKFKIMATISKKLLGFSFTDMVIAYLGEGNEQFEGKNVSQIAKELNMSELDTYMHLCSISDYKGRVNMYQYSTPNIISTLSKHPNVLYMTDSWVEEKGVQNIAIYDSFPKFLHLSLKGSGDTMINTVRKMSGAVADRFMLEDRGYLKEGCYADITVFNEQELEESTPDQLKPFGIKKVFVNGKLVLDNNTINAKIFKTSGKAMRV